MTDSNDNFFRELVDQARGGDADALNELVRRYEPEIRLVARLKLGPLLRRYLDSLDLAQSVHIALFKGLRDEKLDISEPEHLVALAVRMVRWKAARHLRRLYRRQRITEKMAESHWADASKTDPGLDPALLAQLNDTLDQLLATLDEPDRRLIELRLDGHTTAEAARELGLDADVLRVRLSRLRRRLREQGDLADWL